MKIINKERSKKIKETIIDILHNTYKTFPPVFVISGFIQALFYSNHLNINLLFFSIEDYWTFGVSSFSVILPILLPTIFYIFLVIGTTKPLYINHKKVNISNQESKLVNAIFYLILLVFLILPIFLLPILKDESSKLITITNLILYYAFILFKMFPELLKKYLKYYITILFLITIIINSYFEINYNLENNTNNLEYKITSIHQLPKNSQYILSTSNYQIFYYEDKTLLIPNSDIVSIEKFRNSKSLDENKVYKFLKKIYENDF